MRRFVPRLCQVHLIPLVSVAQAAVLHFRVRCGSLDLWFLASHQGHAATCGPGFRVAIQKRPLTALTQKAAHLFAGQMLRFPTRTWFLRGLPPARGIDDIDPRITIKKFLAALATLALYSNSQYLYLSILSGAQKCS